MSSHLIGSSTTPLACLAAIGSTWSRNTLSDDGLTRVASVGKREAPGPAPSVARVAGASHLRSGCLRRLELLTHGAADAAAVRHLDAVGPGPRPDGRVVGADLRGLGWSAPPAGPAAHSPAVIGV